MPLTPSPSWTGAWNLIGSRPGRLLAAATLLLAAGTAWTVARSEPAFPDVLGPVQLAVSVIVPFLGVLAVADLHLPHTTDRRLGPRLLVAVGLAAGSSLAGTLLAAAATAWAGGDWPAAPRAAASVAGAVLVQVIAQLTGTGWGLLLRRPAVAMAATIVVPMAATALLGVIDPGGGLVRWLTPYGNARSLLAGAPSPATAAALLVVTVLWCGVPNLLGKRRTDRDRPPRPTTDDAAIP